MREYVNDFYTVAGDLSVPPAAPSLNFVGVDGYNSVTIINAGTRAFYINNGLLLHQYEKLTITGKENQVLRGNIELKFLKGISSKPIALFIRKKFIN